MEGTLGLGIQSSALSLLSTSSWAATSETQFPPWLNGDSHLPLNKETQLFEGQIHSCRKRALEMIQPMQRSHTLPL